MPTRVLLVQSGKCEHWEGVRSCMQDQPLVDPGIRVPAAPWSSLEARVGTRAEDRERGLWQT